MLSKVTISLFTVLLYTLSVTSSHAVIIVQDTEADANASVVPFTQSLAQTGSGIPGDFEVLMCATTSSGANSFLDPTPGVWSTLDQGSCGGSGECILGIFTRFDPSPDETDNFCNWTVATSVFGAGSFRYSGVDIENPVIAIECRTGSSTTPVAPSVFTEPKSAVIRVFAFGGISPNFFNQQEQVLEGSFTAIAVSGNEFIFIRGESLAFEDGGETGEAEFPPDTIAADWRACTIALRMQTSNIPTLSEWGMTASAAGLMLVGVWFAMRRKKMQDAR